MHDTAACMVTARSWENLAWCCRWGKQHGVHGFFCKVLLNCCQPTSRLLPDCASPPPTSSLEVYSMSKLKVRPWFSLVTSCSQYLHAGLDDRALKTAPLKLSLWLRYVDETFVMWKQGARRFPWTSEWSIHRDTIHHGERDRRIHSLPWRPC